MIKGLYWFPFILIDLDFWRQPWTWFCRPLNFVNDFLFNTANGIWWLV